MKGKDKIPDTSLSSSVSRDRLNLILADLREQFLRTRRAISLEEVKRGKKCSEVLCLKSRLKRENIDIPTFVIKSVDVFNTKEERTILINSLYGALEWANREFRKEFAQLKKLEEEYDTHCVNIQTLKGNIQVIEDNIQIVKKRIREFDNQEKKDDGVQ